MRFNTKEDLRVSIGKANERLGQAKKLGLHEVIENMIVPYNQRLDKIDAIAQIENFKLNFVGEVGVGKSTALCHMINLVDMEAYKTQETIISELSILETGAGRTTLCETSIEQSDNNCTFIEIEAVSNDDFELLIKEFCEKELNSLSHGSIPEEVKNAIVNMAKYPVRLTKKELEEIIMDNNSNEYKKEKEEKLTSKKLNYVNSTNDINLESIDIESLISAITKNAKYRERVKFKFEYDGKTTIAKWIRKFYRRINKGLEAEAPFPTKVRISISKEDLDINMPSNISVVNDSKGIDGNAVRKDIQEIIRNDENIVVFCSPIKTFGNIFDADWIKSTLEHTNDVNHRCMILGLEYGRELTTASGEEDNRVIGMDIKEEQLKSKHSQLLSKIGFKSEHIMFYNSLSGVKYDAETDEVFKINYNSHDSEPKRLVAEINRNIQCMYHELNVEVKELIRQLNILVNNKVDIGIKNKLINCKDEIESFFDDLVTKNDHFSKLPTRITAIHPSSVRGSVNRNGNYYNCDIYSESGQIGSEKFVEICGSKVYALQKFIDREDLFDKENEVELAVLKALDYKIDQEYNKYEEKCRKDYEKITSDNIYKSEIWDEMYRYWGDGNGNYRNRVIDGIMNEIELTKTPDELITIQHSEEFFKSLRTYIQALVV